MTSLHSGALWRFRRPVLVSWDLGLMDSVWMYWMMSWMLTYLRDLLSPVHLTR